MYRRKGKRQQHIFSKRTVCQKENAGKRLPNRRPFAHFSWVRMEIFPPFRTGFHLSKVQISASICLLKTKVDSDILNKTAPYGAGNLTTQTIVPDVQETGRESQVDSASCTRLSATNTRGGIAV